MEGMRKISFCVIVVSLILFLTGCSFLGNIDKDTVLEKYDKFIGVMGQRVLTEDKKLKGERKFGIDTYVGSYEVKYNNFTGEEVLFGGTNINRENNELQVTWDIESEEGNIEVLYYHSSKKPQVLNLEEWENKVISITPGSHYISLKATSFSGKVTLNVSEK